MKDFIRTLLRESLIREGFKLRPNEVSQLVRLGMKSAFDDSSVAKDHLAKTLNELNRLPDPVTLYRVVFVNNANDINKVEVGSHYVLSRKQLEQSHSQKSHVGGGTPIMLTVKAPKSIIDYRETLANRIQYPHESEITLLNKGRGAKIVKTSNFEPKEDDLGLGDYNSHEY